MTNFSILFWFYKKPLICKNRLILLKKYNPDLKIYGLYGGNPGEASQYKNLLSKYLDDFYVFPSANSRWKWLNGDLMILDWFKKRGKNMPWESLIIVQWDLLVLTDLKKLFRGIGKNHLYLSGLRRLDKKLESRWIWTKPGSNYGKIYIKFLKHIKDTYSFEDNLSCCLFIFQIFPRLFFEKYGTIKNVKLGFLEYKIPTYAKIFGIPPFRKKIGCHWFIEKMPKNSLPLNADSTEINKTFIKSELNKKKGFRMFHPFHKIWKDS